MNPIERPSPEHPKFWPVSEVGDAGRLEAGNRPAWSEFVAGARATIPLIVGAIPFGLIFGTLAAASELSFEATVAMSAFVFAGSAQFIAIGMLVAGTTWPVIVLTTFVVNLRHMLYATTLVPHVKRLSLAWQVPLAFWLTDETFAVVVSRYYQPDLSPCKHWYYLGSAVAMYVNWQICTYLGLTVGQIIPNAASWGLDFAMPVTFIGMVIPYLRNKPMWAGVIISGFVSVLAHPLPHKLGLMVAAVAGIAGALLVEGQLKTVTAPRLPDSESHEYRSKTGEGSTNG